MSPKRPRRKAKQARAHQTVDVVLEAAARVLVQRGYATATTNRIAEAAGVSVGTVYEYFAKKDDVFEALIRREIDALVAAIRRVEIRREARLEEKLTQLIVSAMGAMRYGPDLIRALDQVPGGVFRRRLAEARSVVVALVRDLLEQEREALQVRDLDLAAFLVVSAVEGIGANATSDLFGEELADEVRVLLGAYLLGDASRPPRSHRAEPGTDG